MKRIYVLASGVLLLASTPLVADDEPRGNAERTSPIMLNADLNIPKEELPQLNREALLGSQEAAFRLSRFHEFVKLDYKSSEYWISIAAENGHPVSQYNYAFFLSSDRLAKVLGRDSAEERERDRQRAVYWYRMAARNGVEEAVRALRKTDQEPDD